MQQTKKSSKERPNIVEINQYSVDYRAWPIFALSFIRLVFVSIFERALQNFLYFEIDISESTLGFISSAGAIAYIFGPLFGSAITKKIGNRNSIIISSFATPILTAFQLLYFEPWFLIICRILSGLALGLYWPNLLNLLSNWQKFISVEKAKKNFKNFNFSWNFGLLFGLFFGFIWAFSWNDYFAMLVSCLISFLLIPISFFVKKDIKTTTSEKELKIHAEDARTDLTPIGTTETNSNTPMIVYPILFSWLGIMLLTISKSSFVFSFPVLLKASENPSYYTYIVQFGLQAAQLTGLTWINRMKIFTRKISALVGITGIVFVSLTVLLFGNIWYTAIAFIIVGLFLGLLHGVAMKIMLEYGTAKETTKYSTINEILIGIGFGLTPIIAGYVAEVNIYLIFLFLVIFGVIIFISLIFLSRNIKKSN